MHIRSVLPGLMAGFALLSAISHATLIIRANTPGANGMGASNSNVPQTFGDNVALAAPGDAVFETSAGVDGVVGAPDIGLTWATTGGTNANAWQFHTWGGATVANTGGGVLQLDGSAVGSTYSVSFTPNPGWAVVLNGFNFVGDTNGDTYQYRVDVVNLVSTAVDFTTSASLWTTATAQNPGTNGTFAGAPAVPLGFTGQLGIGYRLDLVRVGGTGASSSVDIAIDNLSFDQTAVPEPAAASLLLLGIALLRRRTR